MTERDPAGSVRSASPLLKCVLCADTGWSSPYSTPRNGVLYRVLVPCSVHGASSDVPDAIELPTDRQRVPQLGVDFVVVEGKCACGAASRNGVCVDLACERSTGRLRCGARVWVHDASVPGADDGVYAVCEDHGDGTMTVITYDNRPGRMLIRIPRAGWAALGFPPFPADHQRAQSQGDT